MSAGPNDCFLTCPLCDRPLRRSDGSLRCEAGHSFDVAREGYVNLLTARDRPRGIQGDLPEMVRARRRFLEAGYYAPLLEHLADVTAALLADRGLDRTCIAELGCGEGYYIGGIVREVEKRLGLEPLAFGMDLSKDAVRLASRRYPEVTFFVGDINRRAYLPDGSLEILFSIFAPRNPLEFSRLLAVGGHLLVVIPGRNHLRALREEFGLLEIQEEKEERLLERLSTNFRLVDRAELELPLELPPAAATDLIAMGPNQWHREPGWAVPEGTPPIETEASFKVLRLEHFPDRGG